MKKLIIMLSPIIFCLLSGCSRVSGLDEQLIIYGIGVDKNENSYEISIQAINTKKTSQEKSNESSNMINMNSKGKSLLEALDNMENQTGKEILYSHNLILIIGKDTAKSGINDIINFFATNHKLRPTVEVFIASNSAKDFFKTEDEESIINAEDIFAVASMGKEGNDAIHSNMRYLLGDLNNEYKGAKVWYIELNDNSNVICKKIAIFNDDKLIETLDEDESKAVVLMSGMAKNISDKIEINESTMSYDINKVSTNIDSKIQDNTPIFNINIKININLYNSKEDNITNEEIRNKICDKWNILISNAISKCIKDYKCDIFNFNRYIMNSNLNYYKTYQNRLQEILSTSEYKIYTNVNIKYMGSDQKINSLMY